MRYAFGPFELDTSTLELKRDGEPISIEPQVFELLSHLIENRDRVLSKDDLIESVWNGRIVSDSAISSRIKLVRRAVDDDGTKQAVIKTVHGKGFRFVADLKQTDQSVTPILESEPKQPASQNRWVAIGLVMAAIAGLVLLTQLFPSRSQIDGNRVAVLPISNQTGDPSLDWTELGLMSLVIHDLEARSELPLVADRTIVVLTDRFQTDGAEGLGLNTDLETALKDGYGASHFLVSQLTGDAGGLTLEYRVINPRGESSPVSVSGALAADLAEEMSRQVAATLPRSGERREDPSGLVFDDVYVAETYARARDLQLKGKGAESADMFRVAVAQDGENLDLRYQLAVSNRMAGQYELAQTQFQALTERAIEAGFLAMQAKAQNGLGIVYMQRRDNETALETFKSILPLLDETSEAEIRGNVLTNIGIIERRLRNYEASEEALGRAIVEFQKAGFEQTPGKVYNALALLNVQTRNLPKANDYLEQSLSYHRLVGDRRSEAVALHNIGTNSEEVGDFVKAERLLHEALALRKEMGDVRGQMSSLASLTKLELNTGDADSADQYGEELLRLAADIEDAFHLGRAELTASYIDFVFGDWDAAVQHSASAEEHFASQSRTRNVYREQIRQAVYRAYGGSAAGRGTVERALAWAISENQQGTQLSSYEALNVLSLLEGDLEAAAESIDKAVSLSADMRLHAATGRIAARQGIIRFMRGDVIGATASLGRAQTGFAHHYETVLLSGLVARSNEQFDDAAELIASSKSLAGDNWHLTERLFYSLLEGI